MTQTVRTRIAPSPTGEDLHIGNLYTALFNWAFARKNGGQFIVRIEDTDQKRKIEGSEGRILETLRKFGINPDESVDVGGPHAPYRQSERLKLYKEKAEELVGKGHAYYCFCTAERLEQMRKEMIAAKKPPMYDRHCRNISLDEARKRVANGETHVIRMKIPDNRTITFTDLVRGDISIDCSVIDDQVILKSDGYPTYHLGVVVDDHLMEISYVIRGEEWISSTPKHVLLYEYFEWELPVFTHVSLLRNADSSKLSKRKNPVWASWYLEEGYLPQALLNFLALLGWSHPEEKEIFSIEEFVNVIDLKRIKTVGPIFDIKKLEWLNGEYIRTMEFADLQNTLQEYYGDTYPEYILEKTVPIIQERIKTLKEYDTYCRFFIEKPSEFEKDLTEDRGLLQKVHELLKTIPESEWTAEHIGEKLQKCATDEGVSFSKFFMTIRIALSGKKVTPPLNESLEILGKEEVLSRI